MQKPRIRLYAVHHTLAEFTAYMAETAAAREAADALARAHYARMAGKVIEVDWLEICLDCKGDEYHAENGKPFVVRVLPTPDDDLLQNTGTHLDPRWTVEVVDGRGIVDPDLATAGWCWIFGPAIRFEPTTAGRIAA